MIIDTTLPQPGEHVPLPGQRSLLPDEPVGTEARAALRELWRTVPAGTPTPRVASLRQLDLVCETERNDREFWLAVRAAAEEELGPLNDRRADWRRAAQSDLELGFGLADDAITDEINLMLARLCGPDAEPSTLNEGATMPQAAARRTKTAKPPRPTVEKPAAVETSTTAKPELSGELVMIDIDDLHPSPYQTRNQPTAEWLKELGESLQRDGQLTPCLARVMPSSPILNDVPGLYQLIAGHTRAIAAKKLGWPSLLVRVVACDDATAERLVLIDNAKRKDLDVIEQARALAGLVANYADAGKSQRQLAADIGVSQSEISNAVRLLALPEVWQQRVITEEITKTQARELLPWVDVPDLWPAMETARANDDGLTFDELLHESLLDVSRPMAGLWYDETRSRWSVVAFKATPNERKALNCRKVNGVERAFAWQLWESMQHVAEDKAAKKAGKQVEVAEGKVAAGKLDPQKAAEQFNKRLYRWKVAWLQKRISLALESRDAADTMVLLLAWFAMDGHTAAHVRRESLLRRCGVKDRHGWSRETTVEAIGVVAALTGPERTDLILRTLQEWVMHPADTASTDMPPELVEWLALHLGIDIVRQWSTDRSYLELLTTDKLQRLAAEWHLAGVHGVARPALIDQMLERGKEKPCPKAVREIKAVSLT